MAETQAAFTENSDPDTVSLREWIAKHSDHVDEGVHELRLIVASLEEKITVMAAQVDTIHADVEAARPMVERWQHSMIGKLAKGSMPWSHQ